MVPEAAVGACASAQRLAALFLCRSRADMHARAAQRATETTWREKQARINQQSITVTSALAAAESATDVAELPICRNVQQNATLVELAGWCCNSCARLFGARMDS